MSLKPIFFQKDIKHTNISVQRSKSSTTRAPLSKSIKLNFSESESESGHDAPIPYLKGSSSSEYFSDEEVEPNIKPTQIRKGLKRPMPINRLNMAAKNRNKNDPIIKKELISPEVKKRFLPRPPKVSKAPVPPSKEEKNKRTQPVYIRKFRKNGSPDENVNNWTTTQKPTTLVRQKAFPDNKCSYSEDEESYNFSGDYSNDEDSYSNNDQNNIQETSIPEAEINNNFTETAQGNATNVDENNILNSNININDDSNNITKNENSVFGSNSINSILKGTINAVLNQDTSNEMPTENQNNLPSIPDNQQIEEIPEELPESICYFMERKIVSKFTKNKLCMTLTRGCNSIISQAFDARDESFKIIYNGKPFTILMESSRLSFSLRQGESYGDEVFSVLFKTTKNAIVPKNCVLRFFTEVDGLPTRMQSIQPEINSNGEARISFGHRQVIPSVKNMKFLDENEKEILAVMKIGKDQLCIESLSKFPEIVIFVIGVAAFLNHSK